MKAPENQVRSEVPEEELTDEQRAFVSDVQRLTQIVMPPNAPQTRSLKLVGILTATLIRSRAILLSERCTEDGCAGPDGHINAAMLEVSLSVHEALATIQVDHIEPGGQPT